MTRKRMLKQIEKEMDELRKLYGIPKDMKGDINECRRILNRTGVNLSDAIVKMRYEKICITKHKEMSKL